jgi:hypothetical protein
VFESWLERDAAMAMDFDGDVVGFAAQPFWLSWSETDRARSHAPEFFARSTDGTGIVIDCRPADRVRPRDAEAFAATERACGEVGLAVPAGHRPRTAVVGHSARRTRNRATAAASGLLSPPRSR